MKKYFKYACFLLLVFIINGCTYKVEPVSSPAVNIYSSYDELIDGNYAIVIEDEIKNIHREIKTSSYVCSAHKYPIVLGNILEISIKKTFDKIFKNPLYLNTMPNINNDYKGVVFIKIDNFSPRVTCSMGFWSGTCVSTTELSLGVIIRNSKNERILGLSSGDSATVDGDAGQACEGAGQVLSLSISKAMKKTLEKLAERISNSPKLRMKE